MKITKSMKYQPTVESRELTLYAENCAELYCNHARSIIELLARKMRANKYDSNKAITLWYRLACVAAKRYDKEFGTPGASIFSVTDRYTCAVELEQRYIEEINDTAEKKGK